MREWPEPPGLPSTVAGLFATMADEILALGVVSYVRRETTGKWVFSPECCSLLGQTRPGPAPIGSIMLGLAHCGREEQDLAEGHHLLKITGSNPIWFKFDCSSWALFLALGFRWIIICKCLKKKKKKKTLT